MSWKSKSDLDALLERHLELMRQANARKAALIAKLPDKNAELDHSEGPDESEMAVIDWVRVAFDDPDVAFPCYNKEKHLICAYCHYKARDNGLRSTFGHFRNNGDLDKHNKQFHSTAKDKCDKENCVQVSSRSCKGPARVPEP